MFQCARIKNDLHIKIDVRRAVGGAIVFLLVLIFSIWIFWAVSFKQELRRIRAELYGAVAKSMSDVIQDSFERNHVAMVSLEVCETELKQIVAVNKDLSKMIAKKPIP
jgi:hypothetical protein